MRHRAFRTRQHNILDIEQQTGSIHHTGALLLGKNIRFSLARRAFPYHDTAITPYPAEKIRVPELFTI
jgi:hypothetical protein